MRRKMWADLLPPREPLLKANNVTTVKTGGITAWEQNLKNTQEFPKVLKRVLKSDLVASLERVKTDRAAATDIFLHQLHLQSLHRRSRQKNERVQEWESTSLSVGGMGGAPPSCPSSSWAFSEQQF